MGEAAAVPLGGRRPGVDRRRRARLRPDAARRWPPARRVTAAVAGVGGGHDHRPHRRRPGRAPGPSFDGSRGWGFGVGVQVRRNGLASPVGSYGWAGGLGSSWGNDPAERLLGVVLTTDMFTTAFPPLAVIQDFWTCTYAALGD